MKPIKKYNVNDLTREQWLNKRREGIGGSDTATLLGLNPYKSVYELWLDKIGELDGEEEKTNDAIHFGNQLENLVAAEFSDRSGYKVQRNNFMLAHPEHDFLRANIDREIVGENMLLECKTTSLFNAKKWEGENIPANYIIQVQHYLAVTGYESAYIAVLIGGQKFVYKKIERHEEIIKYIIIRGREFYNENVLKVKPPHMDGTTAAETFLNNKYDESTTREIGLPSKYEKDLLRYTNIKSKIKMLQNEEREIKNNIKLEMEDSEVATVEGYTVTWKPVTTNRVDIKRLKKEYPETYEDVLKQSESRRMQVLEEKGGD